MRFIFSRKGWDGGTGKSASPIFPNGTMASLPIPLKHGRPLNGVTHNGICLAKVVQDLTDRQISASQNFHFDPDLQRDWWPREPKWRPAFGQDGAAAAHLRNQDVDVGDVFVFFGWFRHVHDDGSRWAYVPAQPATHSLFGWLQVEAVVSAGNTTAKARKKVHDAGYRWLQDHPHVEFAAGMTDNNTIYVAKEELEFEGKRAGLPGAGVFRHWHPELQLTVPKQRLLTLWRLPAWWPAYGTPDHRPLSYHSREDRWSIADGRTHLRSVNRGQEFVVDVTGHRSATRWIADLIRRFG